MALSGEVNGIKCPRNLLVKFAPDPDRRPETEPSLGDRLSGDDQVVLDRELHEELSHLVRAADTALRLLERRRAAHVGSE